MAQYRALKDVNAGQYKPDGTIYEIDAEFGDSRPDLFERVVIEPKIEEEKPSIAPSKPKGKKK